MGLKTLRIGNEVYKGDESKKNVLRMKSDSDYMD